jgi:hypothetical protein
MRREVSAAIAIVAFGAVSFAVAWLVTSDDGRRPAAPRELLGADGPAAPAPPPPTVPYAAGLGAPPSAAPVPPLKASPPPPRPPPGSWEAIAPVARPAVLGTVGGAIGRELNELQPRIARCFDEDVQARHGTQPVSAVPGGVRAAAQGATVLMLEVETGSGEARIVDAPVEARGTASDGLIACAQAVLRGAAVRAPGVQPGARHRIRYALRR